MMAPEFFLELAGYVTGLEPKRLITKKRYKELTWYLALLGIFAFGYLRWNAYADAKKNHENLEFDEKVLKNIPDRILDKATDDVLIAEGKIFGLRKIQESLRNTSNQEPQSVSPSARSGK